MKVQKDFHAKEMKVQKDFHAKTKRKKGGRRKSKKEVIS